MDRRKVNASGCRDITAYEAIERVSREEKESEERLKKLLKKIFRECDKSGFHLEERLVLKDINTGRIWR